MARISASTGLRISPTTTPFRSPVNFRTEFPVVAAPAVAVVRQLVAALLAAVLLRQLVAAPVAVVVDAAAQAAVVDAAAVLSLPRYSIARNKQPFPGGGRRRLSPYSLPRKSHPFEQ